VRTGGTVFKCDFRIFYSAKNFGYFEIYGYVRTDKGERGLWTFCGQVRKGSIFRDFVRTSFIDGP